MRVFTITCFLICSTCFTLAGEKVPSFWKFQEVGNVFAYVVIQENNKLIFYESEVETKYFGSYEMKQDTMLFRIETDEFADAPVRGFNLDGKIMTFLITEDQLVDLAPNGKRLVYKQDDTFVFPKTNEELLEKLDLIEEEMWKD